MSRAVTHSQANHCSFPRVSGDEPEQFDKTCDQPKFSPRERG